MGTPTSLFGLAFMAAFGEGAETALFLSAAAFASAAVNTPWSTISIRK